MDKPLKFFLFITAIFVTLIGVFVVATIMKSPPKQNLIPVDEPEALIKKAKQQASVTLDSMQHLFKIYPDQTFVRFSFEPVRDHVEHLWGKVTKLDSAYVSVEVIRKGDLEDVYYPGELELNVNRIEDWLVELPDGNIRGGFTSQAILMLDKNKSDADHGAIEKELDKFLDKLPVD